MPYFNVGDRVIFNTEDGSKHRGRITQVLPKMRKVVTDSGNRLEIPVRRLRPSPDRALILEGRLDRNLRSNRAYGPMLHQWLSAYNVEAMYEKVHTIEDLRKFLAREGKDVNTRFIHIMCHGEDVEGCGTARLHLTFEKLDIVEECQVFKDLQGKILIFSCCEIGNDEKAMKKIKETSGAAAVISYRISIYDSYSNLAEVMLYDRLIKTNKSPEAIVEQVQNILKQLDAEASDAITKKPVLVCY